MTPTHLWPALRRLFGSHRLELVFSPDYHLDLGGTPIDSLRAERILTYVVSEGWARPQDLVRPLRASLKTLAEAHGAAYLESLRDPSALIPIVGFEVRPELHERALFAQRSAVGGTIRASRRALETRSVVFNLGGGFHHAGRDSGKGFCIFNDVGVAVAVLRRHGFAGPVLVIDLDLHDGNGTREIFVDDATVFTFSIHNQTWDDLEAEASLSVELAGAVDDDAYREALHSHLPEILDRVRPGLVYYLAGTDPAHDDALGNWKLSAEGMLERDRYVLRQIEARCGRTPVVALLAGGYGRNAWRYSARFLAWVATGRRREPPTTSQLTMARYRGIGNELRATLTGIERADDDWGLTEEDIYGGLGASARPRLLLGHYSLHGIEVFLERAGFLDRLRGLGFKDFWLDFDLDNPGGQTVRLFAGTREPELLVEIRMSIDRRSVADADLLRLEWLLLQNPRTDFPPGREPLPGQSHPGLGLLGDVMALLVLVCERLELDGILFVPSHYHLAAQGKKYLRFADPEHEAWFRAVNRAVQQLPLIDALRAVEAGRVVDRATCEAVEWRPMAMVLPTSKELRGRFAGEAYEGTVAEEAGRLDFELHPLD